MEKTDYFKLLAVIGAVITFIVTYFNKEEKKYSKLTNRYFNDLLVPYVSEYRNNKGINPIKYIRKKYNYNDYYIPTYIFYLLENNDKENLHKVLIEDYKEKFPSSSNIIWNTVYKIFNIMDLIFVFISLYFVLLIIMYIFQLSNEILSNVISYIGHGFNKENLVIIIGNSVAIIIFTIFLFVVRPTVKNRIITDDEYSTKIKNIESLVKRKVKKYNKRNKYEYLS